MPPVAVYRVNFFPLGNLYPVLDVNGWGPMQQAPDIAGVRESWLSPAGLNLAYTRHLHAPVGEHRVHLALPPMAVPLATRLFTRVSFDSPQARVARLPAGTTGEVEPWAVALRVRFGSPGVDPGSTDARTHVTCQFHRTGVRLNTPGALQGDGPSVLDGPLDYGRYSSMLFRDPTRFNLEHAFCGVTRGMASPTTPHVTGSGSLSIGGRQDHRVYSARTSLGSAAAFIKELAIVLTMTEASFGRISVRLRHFTVYVQDTASAADEVEGDV